MASRSTQVRHERRARGECARCGVPSSRYRCPDCRERHLEWARTSDAHHERMREAQKALQDGRRAAGLCYRCGAAPEDGKGTCTRCLDRQWELRQGDA